MYACCQFLMLDLAIQNRWVLLVLVLDWPTPDREFDPLSTCMWCYMWCQLLVEDLHQVFKTSSKPTNVDEWFYVWW